MLSVLPHLLQLVCVLPEVLVFYGKNDHRFGLVVKAWLGMASEFNKVLATNACGKVHAQFSLHPLGLIQSSKGFQFSFDHKTFCLH